MSALLARRISYNVLTLSCVSQHHVYHSLRLWAFDPCSELIELQQSKPKYEKLYSTATLSSELRCPNSDPHGQILTCPQCKHFVPFLQKLLSCCHGDLHPHPCHFAKRKQTRDRPPVWLGPCPAQVRHREGKISGLTQLTWNSEHLLGGVGSFSRTQMTSLALGLGWSKLFFCYSLNLLGQHTAGDT